MCALEDIATSKGSMDACGCSHRWLRFPPFRLIAWMFGGVKNVITGAMKRSVNHGASAIYHVATAKSLAKSGGHLYSDRAVCPPPCLASSYADRGVGAVLLLTWLCCVFRVRSCIVAKKLRAVAG